MPDVAETHSKDVNPETAPRPRVRASRPRPRRRGSPASFPSTAGRDREPPRAPAAGESTGLDASGSSASGGIVDSPTTSAGHSARNASSSLDGHAGLRLLAREVHLDERRDLEAARGGQRVERVAELAQRVDRLRLPALEVPDEVPAEGAAVRGVLRREVLGAVLADDRHARLRERRHGIDVHVLRRGDDGHSRPDLCDEPLVASPHRVRRWRQSLPAFPSARRRGDARSTARDGRRCTRRAGPRARSPR